MASPGRVALTGAIVVALIGFVGSLGFAAVSDAYGWELSVLEWAVHLPGWMTPALRIAMQGGNQLAVAAVALAFVIVDRPRRAAVALLAGWGAWALAELAKELVGRPRPSAAVLGFSPSEFVTGEGYPSGHTTVACALALVLVTTFGVPRVIKGAAVAIAALTAVARLHLAVHWPLDVLGGACLGVLVAGLVVVALDPAPVEPPWPGVGRWPVLGPVQRPAAVALASAASALRVATFNVRNGRALDGRHLWFFRRRSTLDAIRRLDADLIGFQEVYGFQRRWLERRLPDRAWVGVGRTDGIGRGEQCPILWRPERFELDHWEVRWFSDDWSTPGSRFAGAAFPRIATLARFTDRVTDRRFGVVNAHLDAESADDRLLSAHLMIDWLDEYDDLPWIVVGDLNAGPDSAPVRALLDAGLSPAAPDGGPGTIHQFTGSTDGRRIDHVLVDEAFVVESATVPVDNDHRLLPSDHWPLVAEIRRER